MQFHAQVTALGDGEFLATAEEMPGVAAQGLSAPCALDRLRDELRYRIEYCPCSSVDDEFIELIVR